MDAIQLYKPGMVSAQAEAAERRYHMHQGKSGRTWLVADQPDAAANIYVSDPDPKSQGFGGATLSFTLLDESTVDMKGPWHTNSDALFKDTGVDIRDRHLTRVVVYERRVRALRADCTLSADGILYMEQEPVMGRFDRWKGIAQAFADRQGKAVYCFMESAGGASDSPVEPSERSEA